MDKTYRLLLAILLLLPLQLSAEITDSRFLQPTPSGDWFTLETDHFRINFKKENRDYAERLGQIAERQHARLINTFNWYPTGKTEIVVNDKVDFSNGASTAYPYNQFFVYLNEPVQGTLKDHIDFTETLFTHEYTHILQMDQAKGLPAKLRRVFGKSPNGLLVAFTMPQLLAPHWVSEGIAIYAESMSGFGRNNNTIFNAMMREEVATGLASFKEESYEGYYGSRWPFGQVYLYGAYFFQFLEQEYGTQAVTDYFDHYSDNLIPWKMNERSRKTTGKSAEDLWKEFQDYLDNRFRPEIEARNSQGLSKGDVLFAEHWQNQLITEGPDGSVFFYHKDQLHTPRVIQLMPDGTQATVLVVKGVTSLDWHINEGLLIAKLGVCENSNLYADLYRIETNDNKLKRISKCARTPRATWAADGQSILAVQTDGAYNQLVRVSLDGEVTELYKMQLGESIGSLALSPDSKTVVAAVKRNGSGWNLELFDLHSENWTVLTRDSAIYSFPFYSDNGQTICFISDTSGTPELHCKEQATDKEVIITRSAGFINEAVLSSDNAIWVSEYTGNGDVIRRLDANSAVGLERAQPRNFLTHEPLVTELEGKNYSGESVKPYSALKTLRPRGWAPLLAVTQDCSMVGVTVSGSDTLGFHRWALSPMVFRQYDESHIGGVFAYSYNDRLSLLLSDVWSQAYEDDIGDVADEPTVSESTKNAQMLLHFPLNHMDWSMDFYVGAAIEQVDEDPIARTIERDTHDRVAGIGVSYENFNRFSHAITQSAGVSLQLQLESFDLLGGDTDYSGEAAVLASRGNVRFGRNQTLSLTVDAGVADSKGKPFQLGGSTDVVDSLAGISRIGQREFSLRGYDQQKALSGTNFARASLAWHMPIMSLYNGFSAIPVGLGKVSNTLFVESGDAWNDASEKKVLSSVGIELSTEILIGYDSLLLPIVFGFASGLDKNLGEDQFYMKVNLEL